MLNRLFDFREIQKIKKISQLIIEVNPPTVNSIEVVIEL